MKSTPNEAQRHRIQECEAQRQGIQARRWRRHVPAGSAQRRPLLALGVYPEVTLGEARQKRDAARKILDAGDDPGEVKRQRRQEIIEKHEQTFEKVAREWHKKGSAQWTAGYAAKILDSLEQNAFPAIGKRPIADISAKEMLDMLNKVEARGALEIASRVKQRCSAVFNYAITRLLAINNPVLPLRGSFAAPKSKNHARLRRRTARVHAEADGIRWPQANGSRHSLSGLHVRANRRAAPCALDGV